MDVVDEKYLLSLESLLDISILLNAELDSPKVIQSAILTCLGQVTGKYGLIYIKEPLTDNFKLSYIKGVDESQLKSANLQLIDENSEFINCIRKKNYPFFYEKSNYKPFKKVNPKIIIPLFAKERLLGLMVLGEKYFGEYNDEDLNFLDKFSMITSNAIENALLYALATKDSKTGLYVHHYFLNRMEEEIYKAKRYGQSFSLVMIDLDHFKKVNDVYGHQCGDHVLEVLGKIILQLVRQADLPCRFGGEEFAVVLPNTDEQGSLEFAERLRVKIEESKEFNYNKETLKITASMGVGAYQDDFTTEEFIEKVDKALYLAKDSGRNQVKTYHDYLKSEDVK